MRKKAEEKRRQISVALNTKEIELLDRIRGAIPRPVYLRSLLMDKEKKSKRLIERVACLKTEYFDTFKEMPRYIGFTKQNLEELELLTFDEVGNLVSKIMEQGARSLSVFAGLDILTFAASSLEVAGKSGTVKEGGIRCR